MSKNERTGALSPKDAAEETYETAEHHLFEAAHLVLLKNVYGGLIFGLSGLFAFTVSAGCPGIEESNPGLVRLLQGLTFPLGLVIIYNIGAELYTGYPMWLTMTALQRRGHPLQYVKALVVAWTGNLAGALFSAAIFTYFTEALSEEPYKSGVVSQVTTDIVEERWAIVFLKATACGYLVTLAMFMGAQNHDGISKALGLHIPFLLSTTARFPHTVEYMYVTSIGMMLGAPLSVWGFLWKAMLPITLGNTVGGAVFTGCYNWWVYMHCKDAAKDRFAELGGEDNGSA